MKVLIRLSFIVLGSLIIGQGIHTLRDGFSPRRLQPFYKFMDDSSKLSLDPEAEKILDQPFYYLGRGRQCFAFQSLDGKYVLKLPRTDIHKTSFWLRALPLHSLKEKTQKNHTRRRNSMLQSFHLAKKELSTQTGTLAVHFGDLLSKRKLTLVDAMGYKHHLPLESTFFALQYKHAPWTQAFLTALKSDHREEAK